MRGSVEDDDNDDIFWFLARAVVPSQGDLAVGTLVLHVLQTVHTEGQAEAGPEHGEADDQAEGPGHGAGLSSGGGGYVHLAAGALDPGWLGAELWHGDLDHLNYRLDWDSWLHKPSSSRLESVLVGRGQVLAWGRGLFLITVLLSPQSRHFDPLSSAR